MLCLFPPFMLSLSRHRSPKASSPEHEPRALLGRGGVRERRAGLWLLLLVLLLFASSSSSAAALLASSNSCSLILMQQEKHQRRARERRAADDRRPPPSRRGSRPAAGRGRSRGRRRRRRVEREHKKIFQLFMKFLFDRRRNEYFFIRHR